MKLWNLRRGQGRIMLLLVPLCIAALLLAGFRGAAAADLQAADAPRSAELAQPLRQLAAAGGAAMEAGSPLRLVLKWQGNFSGKGPAAHEAAAALAQRLGLGPVQVGEEDGHTVYRASAAAAAAGKAAMFWSELGDGTSYVIVTHETADWRQDGGFQAAAEAAGLALQAAGVAAEWNASLQGEAAEQGAPEAALAGAESALAQAFGEAQAEEAYADGATASRSYSVPGLERFVKSGGHDIALQAAVHQDSQDGANRLTIGLPLITIEY
ncbi:YwmB family TATA-box binding protein [Paenibacillus tengchongensis]|uniref:YwmB family TATA-box binding protein n=1 Tax=Paenibacillus tengchongensis TaxID=2608684 RepID=UPI001651F352|nr:YwmB family TATA-box binding protein [Paenibacillus tengchongensis]